MEQELETKKKKKKRLSITLEFIQPQQLLATILEIRLRLMKIFREHIGQENAIDKVDLFEKVFEQNPFDIEIYKREYWWNILEHCIKQLRKEQRLFVIFGIRLFVLQTIDEYKKFHKKIGRSIKSMKILDAKAKEWVLKAKWKDLQMGEIDANDRKQ